MRRATTSTICAVSICVACASTERAKPDTRVDPWSDAPPLEHVVSARDGRTGERLSFDALLDRLADADAVFLGETHHDETTHRVELAAYCGIVDRRGGDVVLALEMFERDVQPALDAYLAGTIDEAEFLSRSRPWANYRSAYRPLIERAREAQLPVVASNFPAPLRRDVGKDGLAALSAEQRANAPAELLASTPAYWRRVDNAVRGHAAMMGPPAAGDARLTSVQSLWDNAMGESCALALARHPGHAVVHVNGGFHSEYWDGTARQLRLRAPKARVATVAIVPVANPEVAELSGAPIADFVVFAEERARDADEGQYAVLVPRALEYRLHVPPNATDAPLLVWLCDEGESSADVLALWKDRVGAECAIAVVEPPYREVQDDLVEGGRWFWPDTFAEDVGALRAGVERAVDFVARHQPVDAKRVCVAGEGTGATVVAAVALLGDVAARVLAFEPSRHARLSDFPLPLPEARGDDPPVAKSLRVWPRAADGEWWNGELAQYRGVGLDAEPVADGGDPWRAELVRENSVRAALGLEARGERADARREHVRVDGPRSRAWARRFADARARSEGTRIALLEPGADAGESSEVALAIRAVDFAPAGRLPRCPGAFGGTTVVVLPPDVSGAERAAWLELQTADPLAKASRFHRLAVAEPDGARTLPVVLEELVAQGRSNALILPAAWCADGATMRALQRAARPLEDRMTLRWRPGLGGL